MRQFSEFLNELMAKKGQGTLADELSLDGATMSRIKSGQTGMNLQTIDRTLEIGEAVIVPKLDIRKLEDALEVMSELWKDARVARK